jgi:hypothetical protein
VLKVFKKNTRGEGKNTRHLEGKGEKTKISGRNLIDGKGILLSISQQEGWANNMVQGVQ